jgi:hypothetical protein
MEKISAELMFQAVFILLLPLRRIIKLLQEKLRLSGIKNADAASLFCFS